MRKLFKLKNEDTKRYQWRHCSVYIVNCEHISNFVLITDFELANIWLVHIEEANTFEETIGYIVRYVVVFKVWIKFINKYHLNLYHNNPTSESVKNFCEWVYSFHMSWKYRIIVDDGKRKKSGSKSMLRLGKINSLVSIG